MGRVTTKGQVTIPKEVRDEMGIQPGDEVVFEDTEAGYVIRKTVEDDRFERWRGVAETDETVPDRMGELRGDRE